MSALADHVEAAVSQPELPEVRLLRPQPGDLIVIRLSERWSDADIDEMTERARDVIQVPDVQVVVLGPGADLEVVRKDGD